MKKIKIFLISAVLGIAVGACEYDFIAPEKESDIPIDEEISFSETILPIFTSRGCVDCHKPGSESPDLTAANTYASINNSTYIDLSNPESSLIYSFIAPESTEHVWKHYSATQAKYVLTWIQQGAKNN